MATPDYAKIGFKCGLEIHQRLKTNTKLFCGCNALMANGDLVTSLERMQRAVVGETGKVDFSTSFESGKKRTFIYDAYRNTSCLVDVDEEPPHNISKDALDISLTVSKMFKSEIPDELHIMRKEVVNGSDPSAFQRTIQIGYDGSLLINDDSISITSISLEEESSGIVSNEENSVKYNVDRIGIPLVEIDTGPDIKTPQQAKDVAYRIGLLLRLTGKVQRGIGSIRQDVNLSIAGGARVEIKGFQELDVMDQVIDNEVIRQQRLIAIKNELQKRNAYPGKPVDVTDIFSSTKCKVISDNLKGGGKVYGAKMPGFIGIIGAELGTNLRLGTEMSDYAKVSGVKGMIHSDEDIPGYGISEEELKLLRTILAMGKDDAFILVAGKADSALRGIERALERAKIATKEVPMETRNVNSKNLTTRFMRPIPGASRMYPETDLFPISISNSMMEAAEKSVPNLEEITHRLSKLISSKTLAEQMLKSQELQLFEELTEKTKADPNFIASILLEKFKDLRRNGIDAYSIEDVVLESIFSRYAKGDITKAAVEEILKLLPASVESIDKIIREKSLKRITGNELEILVKGNFNFSDKGKAMKDIMSKYRLNIDGEELNKLLK